MRKTSNDTVATAPSREREADPERTCILTRAKGSRDDVHPSRARPRRPGRARRPRPGAGPRRVDLGRPAELDDANAKGKLKGALQRAFKTQALSVPADLGARIEAALRQTALDRLGMEARSGKLINGCRQGRDRRPRRQGSAC